MFCRGFYFFVSRRVYLVSVRCFSLYEVYRCLGVCAVYDYNREGERVLYRRWFGSYCFYRLGRYEVGACRVVFGGKKKVIVV